MKLSVLKAGPGSPVTFIRWHAETERQMEESGLGWTHLRPNSFFQNVHFATESIRDQGAFFLPLGEGRVSSVDVRDIAAVAVKTLTEPGHMGTALEITGPEALSQAEVAQSWALHVARLFSMSTSLLTLRSGPRPKPGCPTSWRRISCASTPTKLRATGPR